MPEVNDLRAPAAADDPRLARVHATLATYPPQADAGPAAALHGLLADLAYYAASVGLNLDEELAVAQAHVAGETAEPSPVTLRGADERERLICPACGRTAIQPAGQPPLVCTCQGPARPMLQLVEFDFLVAQGEIDPRTWSRPGLA